MAGVAKDLTVRWRRDYGFRTVVNATGSTAVTALFALYNGWLGIRNRALWNGTICVYYLLLTALRGYLILAEAGRFKLPPKLRRRRGRWAFTTSSWVLLALNLALVAPITLMVRMQRPVGTGLIHAIALAAYATWKITMAIINFFRRRRSRDLVVRQLRTINLMDALVSILTLQNTLIMVNSQDDPRSMLTLAAISSAGIFLIIMGISISNVVEKQG